MRTHTHVASQQRFVDELVDLYLGWRDECVAVQSAYRVWIGAPASERPLAHAAYRAALDREEQAAARYRGAAETAAARGVFDLPSMIA